MSSQSNPIAHPLVVQHNALVNARFNLNTTESRLFIAMLARTHRDDTSFVKCQLSVRDIMDGTSNNYDHVRRMLDSFGGRKLLIEKLGPQGQRLKQRGFVVIPLLAYAEYREGEGLIEAQFNDHLLPYLLDLRDNFTKAQLTELLKLKSASSYRIYWLLREYATFGSRTIKIDELKAILGLSQEYDRFNNFRVRVLDRAQEELAETDLPFTYEPIKQGRNVTDIRFLFKPLGSAAAAALPSTPLTQWETALLAVGVAVASLATVRERLDGGDYDEGYVHFVLAQVQSQVKAGKIKKEGGAVFKALADGYLLPDYRKAQQAPASTKVRNSAALASKRKRLLSELDEQRNSLAFVKSAVIYNDETRPEVVARVQAIIADLEQELVV